MAEATKSIWQSMNTWFEFIFDLKTLNFTFLFAIFTFINYSAKRGRHHTVWKNQTQIKNMPEWTRSILPPKCSPMAGSLQIFIYTPVQFGNRCCTYMYKKEFMTQTFFQCFHKGWHLVISNSNLIPWAVDNVRQKTVQHFYGDISKASFLNTTNIWQANEIRDTEGTKVSWRNSLKRKLFP